ncbi:MAG: cyclic nucleotide-binding domain-containing protein [Acidimicrobiia bacterium]|nr:cyclic nucleotide-binding domain-containing protein [Acidimicrobiia bacterium]
MAVAVERVASIPPFNGLDSDTQGGSQGGSTSGVLTRDTVIRAGSDESAFFVLVEGSLSVAAPNHAVTLSPGDFFGEMGMMGGRRSATVTAETSATALEMSGTHFRELQMELPHVAGLIEEEMAKRQARDQD